MLTNDCITATVTRHVSDSLSLSFSPWKLLFFSFFFKLCVVMQMASLIVREAFFSTVFYPAACKVVTTMGLAPPHLGMLYEPAVSQ